MKKSNFYKKILSIVILLSIFIYFYIDSSFEKRIHDLFLRYKDSIQSYLILNELHSGEKLKVGNIVKDKQIVGLMRYYELVKELKNVVK